MTEEQFIKMSKDIDELFNLLRFYKSQSESAIQLIKDIRHGNIYKDPVDACDNFLIEHGFEKP